MSIKAGALAIFLTSSATSIELKSEDVDWHVQEDESAVVLRIFDVESKTHIMFGCTSGYPTAVLAHRLEGGDGWHVNLRVDDGDAQQFSGSFDNEVKDIVWAQVNTQQRRWKSLIQEMLKGETLKALSNFSTGDTLSRMDLTNFPTEYENWLNACEARGWIF